MIDDWEIIRQHTGQFRLAHSSGVCFIGPCHFRAEDDRSVFAIMSPRFDTHEGHPVILELLPEAEFSQSGGFVYVSDFDFALIKLAAQ